MVRLRVLLQLFQVGSPEVLLIPVFECLKLLFQLQEIRQLVRDSIDLAISSREDFAIAIQDFFNIVEFGALLFPPLICCQMLLRFQFRPKSIFLASLENLELDLGNFEK